MYQSTYKEYEQVSQPDFEKQTTTTKPEILMEIEIEVKTNF
jgi:hypothetical protein